MVQTLSQKTIRQLLPQRPTEGHKGNFGHLAVVAGSRGFAGAVKLCCMGAYRSGVGLVTACVPESLFDSLTTSFIEPMLVGLPAVAQGSLSEEALAPLLSFVEDKSALVIGPGLSRHRETVACVWTLCQDTTLPLVIDADGLNALSEQREAIDALFSYRAGPEEKKTSVIFTPHPGEMSRLTGLSTSHIQRNRIAVAQEYARQWHVVVILKGKDSLVAAPDGRVVSCPLGNEGMATGGSGDILAGICGALLAQNLNAFDAACLAVHIHALAGDRAAQAKGTRAMIASDILDFLPEAWQTLEGDGL